LGCADDEPKSNQPEDIKEGSFALNDGAPPDTHTENLNPQPSTLMSILNPRSTLNPEPSTHNLQPSTLDPRPSTLSPHSLNLVKRGWSTCSHPLGQGLRARTGVHARITLSSWNVRTTSGRGLRSSPASLATVEHHGAPPQCKRLRDLKSIPVAKERSSRRRTCPHLWHHQRPLDRAPARPPTRRRRRERAPIESRPCLSLPVRPGPPLETLAHHIFPI